MVLKACGTDDPQLCGISYICTKQWQPHKWSVKLKSSRRRESAVFDLIAQPHYILFQLPASQISGDNHPPEAASWDVQVLLDRDRQRIDFCPSFIRRDIMSHRPSTPPHSQDAPSLSLFSTLCFLHFSFFFSLQSHPTMGFSSSFFCFHFLSIISVCLFVVFLSSPHQLLLMSFTVHEDLISVWELHLFSSLTRL